MACSTTYADFSGLLTDQMVRDAGGNAVALQSVLVVLLIILEGDAERIGARRRVDPASVAAVTDRLFEIQEINGQLTLCRLRRGRGGKKMAPQDLIALVQDEENPAQALVRYLRTILLSRARRLAQQERDRMTALRRRANRDEGSRDGHPSAEIREAVIAALNELDPEMQMIVRLKVVDGMSLERLAATVGSSRDRIQPRVARAREKLCRRLGSLK